MRFDNVFTIIFFIFLFLSIIFKIGLDIINYLHRKKNEKTIPPELEGYVDEEKLEKINRYSNEKLVFSLIGYVLDNAILLVILLASLIPVFYGFIEGFTKNIYITGLLFFGGYFILQYVLGIPFDLYFNFKIEKKYGFNKMTVKLWIADQLKELLITMILGIILLVPLIFFITKFVDFWWLMIWGFMLLFSLLMQIVYPTFIAPLFNKFKPLTKDELKVKIEKLMNECGFKSGGLFEMDASKRSTHSNAYFTGLGKTKRIVLFDSLLNNHPDEEILAILAHELGHFKFKHVTKNIIYTAIISLIGLYIAYLVINSTLLYDAFKMHEQVKFIGVFLISIISGPILFFTAPIGSYFSKKNEFQADRYSKDVTGGSKPLIDALKKLNVDNLSNLFPADIYAWFYYSHPPLFKRIRALDDLEDNKKSGKC
jgi:STE24 endopeptidase